MLSKAEMKNVKGGGVPPGTPGGDPSFCGPAKGYIVCVDNQGGGTSNFYSCCTTMAEAQAFCPAGQIYGCELPQLEL